MRRLAAAIDGRDICTAAGLLLITVGLALESVSIALVVLGALLLVLALVPLLAAPRGKGS